MGTVQHLPPMTWARARSVYFSGVASAMMSSPFVEDDELVVRSHQRAAAEVRLRLPPLARAEIHARHRRRSMRRAVDALEKFTGGSVEPVAALCERGMRVLRS
jgi:hypothetical protein